MIEINLLPGAQKKRAKGAGGGLSLKLPTSLPDFDRMTAFIAAAWIIAPLLLVWLFFSVRSERENVQVALDQAVADSARYASVIRTQASLRARQDTIAQKLAMIQEIDAGRYVWPHILDEVSFALPPYTWVTAIYNMAGSGGTHFQIEGRTGSLPALTRFMDALEASPFLRGIELISSEQVSVAENRTAHSFALTGQFEQPPLDAIETVPLFEDTAAADTTNAETAGTEVSDGTGTS